MQTIRVALAALSACLLPSVAASEPLSEVQIKLLQSACSTNNTIPKRWLAAAILNQQKVSPLLAEQLDQQKEPKLLSSAEYLLTQGDSICGVGKTLCSDADREAVSDVQFAANSLLSQISSSDGSKFSKVGDFTTSADYFQNPEFQITCQYSEPKAADTDTPQPHALRIRNKAEDLYIPNTDALYKGLKSSTLSFDQDDVAHKRSLSAIGDVGYAIPLTVNSSVVSRLNIVPYLGIDDELSKTAGSKASVKTDTRTFGVMADAVWSNSLATGYLALSPALVSDLQHNSKLFTTTLYYQPVIDKVLNSNHEIGKSPFIFQFIVNAQIHHGHYTDDGDLSPSKSVDYDRFGGTAGFSLLTNSKDYPFTWTTTKSWYHGNGQFATLGKFDSTLAFGFGPDGLFAWSLSYDRGRDVDTTVLQREWKIALGIKY